MALTVMGESSTQVTVNYKMRDMFNFKVGAGLTLKYITFNAIDSLI